MHFNFPQRLLSKITGWIINSFILMQFTCLSVQAIILFGLDNSHNLTDPNTGVPFDAIARVSNSRGASPAGSAIHLGNGYMLTANHVAERSHVSFDGVNYLPRDTAFTPIQVATNVDLKIFRLQTTPDVSSVKLLTSPVEQIAEATMVGWGRGRDPNVAVNSDTVAWGNDSTINKRWALNVPRSSTNSLAYTHNSINYNYAAIITVLGSSSGDPSGLGANEGALTTYDSGSALFQLISGEWYLIGVATTVQVLNSSFFGDDSIDSPDRGHFNYFARVSTYHEEIIAIIPEPAYACLYLAGSLFLFILIRKKIA